MAEQFVYVVSQPSYDGENVDSIWSSEANALNRARQLDSAFISQYGLDTDNGWVANGWFATKPRVWSDWGYKKPRKLGGVPVG